VLSHPDRLVCLHTAGRAFLGCSCRFNLHDVGAIQFGLVFEEGDELPPCRVLLVSGVMGLFKHLFDVQVFDEYGVVFADEPRGEFVLVVQDFPPDVPLDVCNRLALLVVVG